MPKNKLETRARFNINFKPVPVCECCADNIMMQQVKYYTQLPRKHN